MSSDFHDLLWWPDSEVRAAAAASDVVPNELIRQTGAQAAAPTTQIECGATLLAVTQRLQLLRRFGLIDTFPGMAADIRALYICVRSMQWSMPTWRLLR